MSEICGTLLKDDRRRGRGGGRGRRMGGRRGWVGKLVHVPGEMRMVNFKHTRTYVYTLGYGGISLIRTPNQSVLNSEVSSFQRLLNCASTEI